LGELTVEIGESVLQNVAVARIGGSLDLLQHVLAR
jgi:hypothetical protein